MYSVLFNVIWMCSCSTCELIVVHALFRGFSVLIEKHRAHIIMTVPVCMLRNCANVSCNHILCDALEWKWMPNL